MTLPTGRSYCANTTGLRYSKENPIDFYFYFTSGTRNGKNHCKLVDDRKRKFMTVGNVFDLFMLVPDDLAGKIQ